MNSFNVVVFPPVAFDGPAPYYEVVDVLKTLVIQPTFDGFILF